MLISAWKKEISALLCILGIANVLYFKYINLYFFWYQPVFNTYSLLITIYILSRFVCAYLYKPPPDVDYLPSVTVTIACKNEEDSIMETIEAIYRSDFPLDRLQVVAVDDGSTDGTWEEMQRTRQKHPTLELIRFDENKGKRHGMAAGVRVARGEVLVFVDSDSFVRPDAIRKLCQGFVDPFLGAVSGHAYAKNGRANILTRMQSVRYFVAFRVVKAAESLFTTVSCCSGCLAAYRRDYVTPILDHWLNQKFLGVDATFGDDRSLTNFMLRRYRVIYHSEAICMTIVPDTVRKFFRQQLRWKKSWLRESFLAGQFMWRRHPLPATLFYFSVMVPIVSPIIVVVTLLAPLIGLGAFSAVYMYGAVLISLISSLPYLMLTRHHGGFWLYGALYTIFNMLFLVWQTYYALFTIRRNHWGTR